MKTLLTIFAATLILGGCVPRNFSSNFVNNIKEELELNEKQGQAFDDLASAFIDARNAGADNSVKDKVVELLDKKSISLSDLNAVYDDHKNNFDDHYKAIAPKAVAFYATLSAEQKETISEYLNKMPFGGRGSRGRGANKGKRGYGGYGQGKGYDQGKGYYGQGERRRLKDGSCDGYGLKDGSCADTQ